MVAKSKNNQVKQRELVEQARSLPGVAETLDTYGNLRKYVQPVNIQSDQVHNATGGNVA